MALRNQITEQQASFPEPILGVNLRSSEENLESGEARLMENMEYYGGIRIRRGSARLTPASLGAFKILGGHKFYFGGATPANARLVAYNNRVSIVSETGLEIDQMTGLTPNKSTYFTTWPITDSVYIVNGSDTLTKYNGTSFSVVTGTNIPTPRVGIVAVLDRLFAVTNNGIERSNPRVDNVWSFNSNWATLRPSQPGLFTAIHPFTLRGTDTLYSGMLAFQERAYYHITGTNYGDDVTAASPPPADDATIKLMDATVGTASPYSICSVPGVGTFWFTTDLNVYWIPEGSLTGRYVGDKLQSTGATQGLESTNVAQLSQVWMAYFDHMLMLGIPTGSNTYASTQFWMDIRALRTAPERGPVWYGPMTGQTIGRVWVENQQGDNKVMGGEGNSATGAFVYQMRKINVFSDARGLIDTPITCSYQTIFKDFGVPSREKYVQAVHLDLNAYTGTATLDLLDLNGTLASNIPITTVTN